MTLDAAPHSDQAGLVAGFAHIGLTVADLDKAVDWYTRILGCRVLLGPVELEADDTHAGRQAADVFGPEFKRFRQAHLMTPDGVALEIFEFRDPATPSERPPFSYWRPGVFHVCLVAPDIDRAADAIARSGGRMRTSRVWEIFEGEPFRMCYCEDPFGNVIELYSHPHEVVFAGRSTW